MDELTAITRARQLLASFDFKEKEVDVAAIAASLGFDVRERDDLEAGQAGYVVVKGGRKIIVVNEKDHLYRRRFTVMHEVAHHALDLPSIHGSHLGSNELERFKGRPREEVLCDTFAAECLVPWQRIQPIAQNSDFTIDVIQDLSKTFKASHQCVASRFVQASRGLTAYVLAEEGVVRNAIASSALRGKGLWLQTGIALPDNSAAVEAIKKNASTATAESEGDDWSNSDSAVNFSCYEEALYFSEWGQTLSLLTFEEVSRSLHATGASYEEDELLPELTGHLPWPKK